MEKENWRTRERKRGIALEKNEQQVERRKKNERDKERQPKIKRKREKDNAISEGKKREKQKGTREKTRLKKERKIELFQFTSPIHNQEDCGAVR